METKVLSLIPCYTDDPHISNVLDDLDPAERADIERDLRRGAVDCVGVYAEAVIIVGGVLQSIYSGGVYGTFVRTTITDKAYLDELARDEISDLRAMLAALNLDASAIDPRPLHYVDPQYAPESYRRLG